MLEQEHIRRRKMKAFVAEKRTFVLANELKIKMLT
jgi:hypothetical protein